jgi:replicative DNA helicase
MFEGVVENNISKMILDYSKRYGVCMGQYEYIAGLKDLKEKKIIKESDGPAYAKKYRSLVAMDISGWRYILDNLIIFIKHQRTKQLITDAVSKWLPKEDFSAIEKGMAEIASITTTNGVEFYDYFDKEKIEERKIVRDESVKIGKRGIPSGIYVMDEHLYHGGFGPKELTLIMAPPKRGKTMSLLFFGNACAESGHNCLYFTCEVSREICTDRLDAMGSGTLTKELVGHSGHVRDCLMSKTTKGKLFILEYPTKGLTPAEVERQAVKCQAELGIPIHEIIIDYLGLMKPQRRYKDDKWAEQAGIAEDLRGIACKFNIPVIGAIQVNRGGSHKALIKGTDAAGAFEVIMVADEVISLSATEDELRNKKLRIHFSESRNSGIKTFLIETGFAYGKFYDAFLAEEEV